MSEADQAISVVAKLRSIKSPSVRNILRGLIAEKGDKSLGEKTENLLRQAKGKDYRTVIDALSSLQREGEVTLSLPVPPLPPAVGDIVFSSSMPDKAFLAYARKSMRFHESTLKGFIRFTAELDDLVDSGDDAEISRLIKQNIGHFGYSISQATTFLSIRYRRRNTPETEAVISSYLAPINNQRRSIVFSAIEDCFDPSKLYIETRRNFSRIARSGRLSRHVKLYVASLFSPLLQSKSEIFETARAYAGYSIIDLCMYIITSARLHEASGKDFPTELRETVPKELMEFCASVQFGQTRVPVIAEDTDDEVRSEMLLRHAAALNNYKSVVHFRANIERCMASRYDGLFDHPVPTSPIELADRWDPNEVVKSLSRKIRESAGDGLHAVGRIETSGTFAYVITNAGTPLDLTGPELLAALDACESIPYLATAVELSSSFPKKPDDALYELLRTTIIFDADQSLTTDYAVRQATETIVRDSYAGDIVALLEHLYEQGRSIGEYYFGFWTDDFLTQLYGLYDSVEAISETRERMLNWYGEYTDSEIHKERARSLSLENKLVRLRNEIDANRLHVDSTRLRHWMQDEVSTDLRSLITSGDTTLRTISSVGDAQNEILLISDPGLQLARIVSRVFLEFCSNRSFGLDSYIGRRIRHGTFVGTITAEVRTILQSFVSAEQRLHPEIAMFVSQRLRIFETDVRRFAAERIQIRSDEKPKGLIVPSIDSDAKLSILKLIYNDVEPLLTDTGNVPEIMELFQQHCWLLVAPDLVNMRQQLERYRTERLFIDSRDLPGLPTDAPVKDARIAIHRANAIVQERVAQIASWFAQPPETLPSATLEELFQIVVEEARIQVSGYDPQVEIDDTALIRVLGHRYQYVYDALYVIVKNAAFYGDRDGSLRFATRKTAEREKVVVKVEISNSILSSDTMDDVLLRIDQAMKKPIDGAMVREGKSGIPKLRYLENEDKEIRNVSFSGSSGVLTCSFELFLAAA
ncbi:hypothetical protein G6K88_30950 [Agrobacterium rhizogenes]|uniref:hypothetical protein n=1 Tax=Rhizobium rhizogenes TaxID=359 RepID=UPI00115DC853|nr:hypothetical protein [Rhizobium rhizogenes]NTG38730.1 hypothetical protein [Rhizobium rhizogenes]NTG58537.1 hypothetical protein [Rhizobium rhizogenes]NTI06462.1 hypothetical protein [Rhizobium rhizogenes]NTI13273.1 hypothetical protein [Rhizobium rhizogenes]TRB15191.1 hypothetical protein EXN70_33980 [Rhizobium rhizogenes]